MSEIKTELGTFRKGFESTLIAKRTPGHGDGSDDYRGCIKLG